MRVDLPSKLDATWIEASFPTVADAGTEQIPLHQDVFDLGASHWTGSRLFAEARIHGACQSLAASGRRIEVETASMPSVTEDPSHAGWDVWRESVGGVVVSHVATELRDTRGAIRTDEIREIQRAQLTSRGGELGDGKHRGLFAHDHVLSAARTSRVLVPDDDVQLRRRRVDATLRRLCGNRGTGLGTLREEHRLALVDFVDELIDNTNEHAMFDRHGQPVRGGRFVLIRRVNARQEPPSELTASTSVGPLSAYLDRVTSVWDQNDVALRTLVEVTVADSGVGIAAHLAGTTDVYLGEFEEEERLAIGAMTPGVTSKPPSNRNEGLGLWKAGLATADLDGLMVVRCGRLQLTMGAQTPGWITEERSFQRGTAVSILWPWRDTDRDAHPAKGLGE